MSFRVFATGGIAALMWASPAAAQQRGTLELGAFGSFVFSDVTVTLAYRPISQTRYYLAGRWDSTELNVGNPVLDIDLSYTFR